MCKIIDHLKDKPLAILPLLFLRHFVLVRFLRLMLHVSRRLGRSPASFRIVLYSVEILLSFLKKLLFSRRFDFSTHLKRFLRQICLRYHPLRFDHTTTRFDISKILIFFDQLLSSNILLLTLR